MQDIFEQVKKIAKEEKDINIELSSSLDKLGFDSLDLIELVIKIEDKYNINIPDEHIRKMKTVKDVIEYIKKSLPS